MQTSHYKDNASGLESTGTIIGFSGFGLSYSPTNRKTLVITQTYIICTSSNLYYQLFIGFYLKFVKTTSFNLQRKQDLKLMARRRSVGKLSPNTSLPFRTQTYSFLHYYQTVVNLFPRNFQKFPNKLRALLPGIPVIYTVVCKIVHKFASVWCKTALGEVGVSLP